MSTQSLSAEAEAIHNNYRKNFANRARATRNIGLLDQIIKEMDRVAAQIPAGDALGTTVGEWQNLYRTEREAIADVQAGGSAVVTAWRHVEWSDLDFWRYGRLFAGQDRRTRDLGVLKAMAADQAARISAVGAVSNGGTRLAEALEQLKKNGSLYTSEVEQIGIARAQLPAAEHARILAMLANGQFALYRTHFAEKARGSRRPALLRRILGSLQDILKSMEAVRELGVRSEAHLGNINKVSDRIRHHQSELVQIEQARAQSGAERIAGMIGDDANRIFEAYRNEFSGKNRATVSLARLSELCDGLHEIAANMQELQSERPTDVNGKNLEIVLDTLKMYEREFIAVKQAQKK